ncbi:MAG: hypothetical protein DMG38_09540 [Acidobacteria bacterium]|nr:MAG: hypothetical protein DMG38_09540 [Acidobacteriota bacterium]
MTLEEALVTVWRTALVENSREIELDGQTFPVRTTPKKRLRQVDFVFDGQETRRFGTKSGDGLALGATGPRGTQGHAISFRGPFHR